jgi:hypothetical protein
VRGQNLSLVKGTKVDGNKNKNSWVKIRCPVFESKKMFETKMPPLERVFAMVRLRLSIPCEAKPVEDQKDASGCFRSPHFRPFACMPYNVLYLHRKIP